MNKVVENYDNNILDIFRIIATFRVFWGHFITHYKIQSAVCFDIWHMLAGVPLLFLLCGFLAAKTLDSNRSTKDYLIGRFYRMMPEFWLCVAINTVVIAVIYDVCPTLKETLVYLVTQFGCMNFYTGDWLRGYGVSAPNGSLWTVVIQMQFFMLVPFAMAYFGDTLRKKWGGVLAVLIVVSAVYKLVKPFVPLIPYKLIGVTVVPYLYIFYLGMLIWIKRDVLVPFAQKYWFVILSAYIVFRYSNIAVLEAVNIGAYGALSLVLTTLLIAALGFIGRWRMKKDYTYGFYMYHMVVMNALIELNFGPNLHEQYRWMLFPWIIFITLILSIVGKKISDRVIEVIR